MEDGSPIIVAAVGFILAAFGIWLTVRLVNRGKRPSARFCACVLLAIAVGALSLWIPYRREQQAINEIERWGGVVTTYSGTDWLRRLVGEDRLRAVKVFDRVARVQLSGTSVVDVEIAQLVGLTNIEALYLDGTMVTDHGLADLGKLTNIESLSLRDTAVTDAGLARLGGLANLRVLDLDETNVTDVGLAHLSGLMTLGCLSLCGTGVTGAGLVHLNNLTNLAFLNVDRTAVTSIGFDELKNSTAIFNPDYPHIWPFQNPEAPALISVQHATRKPRFDREHGLISDLFYSQ
jgi:hypothetical protein